MNINEIDGIERISSKFYKDVEAIITNAKKMPDVNKLVAFGNTLDVKTKDLDPDDDLLIAVYLNDDKTYEDGDLYDYSEQLEKDTHIIYACIMQWPDYASNEVMNRDIGRGVLLYGK